MLGRRWRRARLADPDRLRPSPSAAGTKGDGVTAWDVALATVRWLAAAWWLAAIATFVASLSGALLQPRIQRRRATATATPPVSLILPVKLVDPGFERAQASAFAQDLADYEVIVGAAEHQSPALDILRRLAARGAVPARLLRAPGIGATSPKLDNLAAGIEAAAHDVVVTKDSNITFSPDTARVMLRSLAPGVGMVVAVPVAVRAESFAGNIEAILINRDARLLLTASAAGKGFGVGKVMIFRRSDLARAGGVAAMRYTIAEDSALSKGFAAIGLRTRFAENTVDQEIGARALAAVYGRQARWAVIRRAEEPATFAFEPVACPVPAAFAAALAAPLVGFPGWAGFVATLVGWYAIEVAVTAAWKRWELRPWTPAAFLGRDAVLLTAWARAWFTREVTWAGGKRDVRDVLHREMR
ncbi:MAG: glycosyltransferase [Caulobacteraceae bacterium]|nr:glycosyltransferase [Caulobacter sp.]